MAQFDVHPTRFPAAPFVVVIQSPFLDHLETRAILPLEPVSETTGRHLDRLHPVVNILGKPYVLNTAEISHLTLADLRPAVLSLANTHRQVILDALDFLLHGF